MAKFYEVRCTASAEIVELWRVQADSEDQAIEAIEEGKGEFIRQCSSDEERDRRDWLASEIEDSEYLSLGQFDHIQAAAPDMLAALIDILPHAEEEARALRDMQSSDDEEQYADSVMEKIERARAAIAKAKGQGV